MQKKRERITFILVLGIFAALVVNLNLFSFRFDLTSTGAYSISPASKEVVAKAKENIYLTFYQSKQLKTYYPVIESLTDFVEVYAQATGGRIKVKVVDPKESGELADMERLGIQGNQIDIVEDSQATQAVVYTGIVLTYLDRQQVLPMVTKLETLEYDLTGKINTLITQKTKSIGLLVGDSSKTVDKNFRILGQQLDKDSTFSILTPTDPITPDLSGLIVAGSENLDDAAAYRIDQYIMHGGKVFFALDGVHVDMANNQPPSAVLNNPVLKMTEAYGVKVQPTLVADAYNATVAFNSPQGAVLKRYVLWPQILPKNTDHNHPVTSRFSGLTLLWNSPLLVAEKNNIQSHVLATTSDKSWIIKDNFSIDPDQASLSGKMPGAEIKSSPVAVTLSGKFTSAFTPDSLPKSIDPKAAASFISQGADSRILVVGGSSFLSDYMQATGATTNVDFVEAGCDWLTQDNALLSIKNRTYRDKSLTILQDPPVRQGWAFFLSFVNLGILPLVILAVFMIRFLQRKRRELKS